MNNKPLISIIVPNYNKSLYLKRCFESIAFQTYPNIELVIIDDNSSDESVSIIETYRDLFPKFLFIRNNKNVGVSLSRDLAIRSANGYYLSTLDSDDYYSHPRKLELEYNLIKNHNNRISFSGIILVNSKGEKINKANKTIKEGDLLTEILTRKCMIPRDFLFTCDQYRKSGGYDHKVPIYEDWDFKIRLAINNYFCFTGIDAIAYRRTNFGLSSSSKRKHVKWLKYVFNKNIIHIDVGKRDLVEEDFYLFLKKEWNYSSNNEYVNIIKKKIGTMFC